MLPCIIPCTWVLPTLDSSQINHLLSKASFALDTFPYPGVATAFDYIHHGLPLVTSIPSNLYLRNLQSIELYQALGLDVFSHENQISSFTSSIDYSQHVLNNHSANINLLSRSISKSFVL